MSQFQHLICFLCCGYNKKYEFMHSVFIYILHSIAPFCWNLQRSRNPLLLQHLQVVESIPDRNGDIIDFSFLLLIQFRVALGLEPVQLTVWTGQHTGCVCECVCLYTLRH